MFAYPGCQTVQRSAIMMFQFMTRDPDNLAVMAAENVLQPLRVAEQKYTYERAFNKQIKEMIEVCEGGEASRGAQHQEILGIIFAGVLRMLLTAIEDARRNKMCIGLPKFAAFMKYLSAGTGMCRL